MQAYFGHHKCATTWMVNILSEMMADLGLNTYLGQISILEDDRLRALKDYDFVISANTCYEKALQTEFEKAFHIIRDPRDIIVSAYFSHLYSHSTKGWDSLAEHRKRLQKLNLEEGLLAEMEFSSQFFDHMKNWNYNNPNILELKMEDVVVDPVKHISKCIEFLGLINNKTSLSSFQLKGKLNKALRKLNIYRIYNCQGVPDTYINYISEKNSFKRLSKGRERGKENKRSHYRKGEKNDWVNYFEEIHKSEFKRKFPLIMEITGYSTKDNW